MDPLVKLVHRRLCVWLGLVRLWRMFVELRTSVQAHEEAIEALRRELDLLALRRLTEEVTSVSGNHNQA